MSSTMVSYMHEVHRPLGEHVSRWRRPLRLVVRKKGITVIAILILGLSLAGESSARVQAKAQKTGPQPANDLLADQVVHDEWSSFLGSSIAQAYEPVDLEALAKSALHTFGHFVWRKQEEIPPIPSATTRRKRPFRPAPKVRQSPAVEGMIASAVLLKKAANSRRSHIKTKEYLASIEAIMPSFEALGMAIHAASVKDLLGNAKKLERNGAPELSIAQLVSSDHAIGNHTHPDSSYQAFLWLTRILRFAATFFQELVDHREASLTSCLVSSYEAHLGPYHNVLMRSVAVALMQIIPDRPSMIRCFRVDDFETLIPYILNWAHAAMLLVDKADALYISLGEPTIVSRAKSVSTRSWSFSPWTRSSRIELDSTSSQIRT